MKSKCVFIFYLLFFGVLHIGLCQSGAKYNRHEIKLGYRISSRAEFAYISPNTPYSTFQVNYNYAVIKRLSLGVQASYTSIHFQQVGASRNGTLKAYNYRFDVAQLYGRLNFHYLLKPRLQIYSGVMAGNIYLLDKGQHWWMTHIDLLGFRFGKLHAFYAELGLGFSSTLTVGYSARF